MNDANFLKIGLRNTHFRQGRQRKIGNKQDESIWLNQTIHMSINSTKIWL